MEQSHQSSSSTRLAVTYENPYTQEIIGEEPFLEGDGITEKVVMAK